MGEYADLAIEQEMNQMCDEDNYMFRKIKQKINLTLWPTKNEGTLKIAEMGIGHIKNCLNLCKKHKWRTEYIPVFEKELEKRGE